MNDKSCLRPADVVAVLEQVHVGIPYCAMRLLHGVEPGPYSTGQAVLGHVQAALSERLLPAGPRATPGVQPECREAGHPVGRACRRVLKARTRPDCLALGTGRRGAPGWN